MIGLDGKLMAAGVQGAVPENFDEMLARKRVQKSAAPGAFDEMLARKRGAAPLVDPSKTEVAEGIGRGGLQGASFGTSDEGAGATQAVLQAIANALPAGALEWAGIDNRYDQDVGETYRAARDADRAENEKAQRDQSALYNAAEMGGGVAMSLLGGAALKGAGTAGKVLSSAPVQGALNSFGHAEGSAGEQLLETGAGALTSYGVDRGLKGLGSRLKGGKLTQWFGQKGDDLIDQAGGMKEAVKSVGSEVVKPAVMSGLGSAAGTMMGNPKLGAVIGTALGAGDAVPALLKSPAAQGLAAKGAEMSLRGAGRMSELLARPAVLEWTDDPEDLEAGKLRRLHEWLTAKKP